MDVNTQDSTEKKREKKMNKKSGLVGKDENIRYIRRYIFDISDIGDVRYDIGNDRYIVDISVLDRYIVKISGLWHTRALVEISKIY